MDLLWLLCVSRDLTATSFSLTLAVLFDYRKRGAMQGLALSKNFSLLCFEWNIIFGVQNLHRKLSRNSEIYHI